MERIAFFDTKPYDRIYFDKLNRDFELVYFESRLRPESVKLAEGCRAVCAFVNDDIGAATVRSLADIGVEMVAMRCAGYNNVALKEAAGKLRVVRVPAYSPYAVAEHAMGMILMLNRKLHKAYIRTRDFNFSLNGLIGFDLHGKTAGVIGTGKIGRSFIDICRGFGMEVIANDPFPAEGSGIDYVSREELFRRSDIISLHCPLTDATRYMIDGAAIGRMKPGVMLINTGRGQLIHTEALIEGLKEKKIGAAGLDVYEEEAAYFYEDTSDRIMDDDVLARLLSFNNVVMTSHQGFFTREALDNIAHTTLQNINDFAVHRELRNEVRAEPEKTMN